MDTNVVAVYYLGIFYTFKPAGINFTFPFLVRRKDLGFIKYVLFQRKKMYVINLVLILT